MKDCPTSNKVKSEESSQSQIRKVGSFNPALPSVIRFFNSDFKESSPLPSLSSVFPLLKPKTSSGNREVIYDKYIVSLSGATQVQQTNKPTLLRKGSQIVLHKRVKRDDYVPRILPFLKTIEKDSVLTDAILPVHLVKVPCLSNSSSQQFRVKLEFELGQNRNRLEDCIGKFKFCESKRILLSDKQSNSFSSRVSGINTPKASDSASQELNTLDILKRKTPRKNGITSTGGWKSRLENKNYIFQIANENFLHTNGKDILITNMDPKAETIVRQHLDTWPFGEVTTIPGVLNICHLCKFGNRIFNLCASCKAPLLKLNLMPDTCEQKSEGGRNTPTQCKKRVLKTPRKKGAVGRPKKLKKHEECIVVLSSDDEKDGDADEAETDSQETIDESTSSSCAESPTKKMNTNVQLDLFFENESVPDLENEKNENSMTPEDVIENAEKMLSSSTNSSSHSTFQCRSVRIGTYKMSSPDLRREICVHISHFGLLFSVWKNRNQTKLAIPFSAIQSVKAHFRPRMPLLIVHASEKYMEWIRKKANIDPDDLENSIALNCQRCITFVVISFSDMCVGITRRILGKKISEIDYDTANKTLVKLSLSPDDYKCTITDAMEAERRIPPKVICKPTTPNKSEAKRTGSDYKEILIYQDAVIQPADIMCLDAEQFLNDAIILFWIRFVTDNLLKERKESVHIFNSYFYQTLTDKNKGQGDNTAEKRHSRVKKWTKNVNLFEKDFIIIPVNDASHWFLVIVCYPGLENPICGDTGEVLPKKLPLLDRRRTKKKIPGAPDSPSSDVGANSQPSMECNNSNVGVPGSQEINFAIKEKEPAVNEELQRRLEDPVLFESMNIKAPCIFLFDSLKESNSKAKFYNAIRDYLQIEYRTRYGVAKPINKVNMPGFCPAVPQQNNHFDCGIFLLQYVESFFQQPIRNFAKMPKLKNWFDEKLIADKRRDIYQVIETLVKERSPNKLALIPTITFGTYKHITETQNNNGKETDNEKGDEQVGATETSNIVNEGSHCKMEVEEGNESTINSEELMETDETNNEWNETSSSVISTHPMSVETMTPPESQGTPQLSIEADIRHLNHDHNYMS